MGAYNCWGMNPDSRRLAIFLAAGIGILLAASAALFLFKVNSLSREAVIAESDSRYADQAEALIALSRLEPWREDLMPVIGRALFNAQDFPGASEWFANAEENGDLNFENEFLFAEALKNCGEPGRVGGMLERLGKRNDLEADEILKIAGLLRSIEEREIALVVLETWQAGQQEISPGVQLQIVYLRSILSPDSALTAILSAGREDPELMARFNPLVDELTTPRLTESERWYAIGTFLFNQQEWELSEFAFQNALKGPHQDSEALAMLGQTRLMQGEEGYADLVRAIHMNSSSRLARYFLALYWRERGQTAVAGKYLSSLAAEEPQEPLWQIELGKTAFSEGDTNAALAHFIAATRNSPENLPGWQALAEFTIANGIDLNGIAEEAAQRALLMDPNDPISNDLMGWLLLGRGDADNALKFLRQSIAANPDSARTRLHLAQALRGIGDLAGARDELQRAAALDPGGQSGLSAARLLNHLFPGE